MSYNANEGVFFIYLRRFSVSRDDVDDDSIYIVNKFCKKRLCAHYKNDIDELAHAAHKLN